MRGSGHQFARAVQVLVMALVVVPGATVSVAAAAGPSDGNIDMSGINAVAIAHGALGGYLDSAGAPVVVIPSVGMKTLTTADLAPAGVLVRVQTATLRLRWSRGSNSISRQLGQRSPGTTPSTST
jgi:hypothetical protein